MIPITVICDNCNKEFQSNKYQLVSNGHELCRQCALRLKLEVPLVIGEKYNRLEVIGKGEKSGYSLCRCDCGTIKEVGNSELKSGHTKSCGCLLREIASNHLKELHKTQYGENHPNWKGGITPLRNSMESSKKYKDIRENLKNSKTCARCGTSDNLVTHHKVPFCKDSTKFLDEDNMVVLCETCHRLYHNIYGFNGDDKLFEEFLNDNTII